MLTIVLYLCLKYIIKTVCWYVCLSLVFIISDYGIVCTSTGCLRSDTPDLFIDLFHNVCIL